MKNTIAGKTITATVWLAFYASHSRYVSDEPEQALLSVFSHDPSEHDPEWCVLEQRTLSLRVPDDFDPVAPQVAALQAKKAKLTAEFAKAVADLNRQLSELQAIEHNGATA